jgi:hypothetical protein
MSREERRAYQRQMKSFERSALPPAAQQRADRNAARRAARKPKGGDRQPAAFDRRFWLRSGLVAAAIGFVGFSLQWSEGMPWALYVGLGVAVMALALLVGFRLLQRRATGLGPAGGEPR